MAALGDAGWYNCSGDAFARMLEYMSKSPHDELWWNEFLAEATPETKMFLEALVDRIRIKKEKSSNA